MQQVDIYQYKSYLFTIAYNMLGDIVASEDLVQDTFEKWLQSDHKNVKHIKAYLSRILINKAIDKLEKLNKQREAYKGLWMPEPLLTEQDLPAEHTLEYALLLLLEKLNPYERAVFVLKEVFSLQHQEIATILNITIDNCRQILHRAKEKVRSPKKHRQADMQKQQELLEAFLQAVFEKNLDRLHGIFLEDITMYQDGGGKMAAALKPITGSSKIIRFLDAIIGLEPDVKYDLKPVWVNCGKGILILRNNVVDTVFSLEVERNKISKLFFVRNPDKIFFK